MSEQDYTQKQAAFLARYGHYFTESNKHWLYWKKNYHDPTSEDPVTNHIINKETKRCFFCPQWDKRDGMMNMLHIMGSI